MAAKPGALKVLDEKALRKKYATAGIASIIIPSKEDLLWLPSRNLSLNWQLGGGIPYGRIIELIGYESTGKTLMAQDFCSVCQALGGQILWDDAEGAWTNYWAEQNGIDPSKVELYTGNDVEGFSDWFRDMILFHRSRLVNNEPIVAVVDSIAALECAENIDSDQKDGKAEMGNRAKAIYKMYRKRNQFLNKYGVILIAVNQVREKVGASIYEDATTTPGGAATKFYASQRVILQRGKQILMTLRGKEVKIGQNVFVRVMKNKVAPPMGSQKTEVHFRAEKQGYVGYSRYAGLPDIFQAEGLVTKKGSRYYRKEKMIANGEEGFLKLLHTNDALRSLLIKRSSINTVSKTKEKLALIAKNLYIVKLKEATGDEGGE